MSVERIETAIKHQLYTLPHTVTHDIMNVLPDDNDLFAEWQKVETKKKSYDKEENSKGRWNMALNCLIICFENVCNNNWSDFENKSATVASHFH